MSGARAGDERRGTPDQRRAIESRGADLCVVAGAGTGKTFVLTERLVRRVLVDRVDLSEVLAITFTEKAAAEMKDRLAAALERAGRPGARQAVEEAAISTVHAFCARLLREHAVAAGVDPAFVVLDEIGADRALREALDRFVDEWREREPAAFATLATLGGDDPAETLVALYREAQASGSAPAAFVRRVVGLPSVAGAVACVRTAVERVRPHAATGTDGARKRAAAVLATLAGAPATESPYTDVQPWLGSVAASFDLRCGEPLKSALAAVRACAAEAASVVAEHELAPLREVAARAVERLDAHYDEVKGRGQRLDFADLERAAVALLERRPDVREQVRSRRPEVLVDEFQDTNPVQARLVDLLRTDGRLFVVGDPKQAIYGFRGADVTVFEDRLRTAAAQGPDGVVTLSHSFRARPELLGFVNRLFEGGVGRAPPHEGVASDAAPDVAAPDPAADVHLAAGRTWAAAAEPCVEVRIAAAETMPEAREREAAWIADRVVALVESKFQIAAPTDADPAATRACDFGDVAVLLRATTNVKTLEQAFVARDVPYLVVKGRGFFRAREVIDAAHLLACVDDPRDDLSFAAVLRSPACGVSDDGLFALCAARERVVEAAPPRPSVVEAASDGPASAAARGHGAGTAAPRVSLSDVVFAWAAGDLAVVELPEADAVPLARFVAVLSDLRARRAADGVAALVGRALALTRLDVLALGRPNGRQRAANLRKVRTLARTADDDGLSLREFVDDLRTLRAREVREAEAAVAGGARGAVSVMTVHAAKGLEFPIVVVPDVGRVEVLRGGRIVADVRDGVGIAAARSDDGGHPWAYTHVLAKRRTAEAAESDRLLYVAVTRASDHLVLTGAFSGSGEGLAAQRRWWRRIEVALGLGDAPDGARDRDVGPGADDAGRTRAVVRLHPDVSVAGGAHAARTLLGRVAARVAAGCVPPLALRPEARRDAAVLLDEAARVAPSHDFTPFATNVSALTVFARCPQEYRLRYVVGVPEDSDARLFGARSAFDVDEPAPEPRARAGDDDEPESEPSTRAVGRAAHAALERLVPTFRRDVAEEVRAALRAETGGAEPSPADVARVSRWIDSFRTSDLGHEVARASRADVRREQAFLLRAGRTAVRGQIDLLFHAATGGGASAAEGNWTVVDYKTGALGGAGHGQAGAEHALQMRLYALGVRAVTGALPSRLVLWSLPRAAPVTVACGPDEVAATEALLAEFGRRTSSRDLAPRASPPCATCRVRAACGFSR